jgi:hypothetical protein
MRRQNKRENRRWREIKGSKRDKQEERNCVCVCGEKEREREGEEKEFIIVDK